MGFEQRCLGQGQNKFKEKECRIFAYANCKFYKNNNRSKKKLLKIEKVSSNMVKIRLKLSISTTCNV